MIRIRVLEADNLPVYNNQFRKTLISCFSVSSYRYYYGSFKSKEKTTHPSWNAEFDVDLFRLVELNFSLYGTRLFSKDIFLGNATIDFIQFVSKPPGNQIIGSPDCSIRYEFPITDCDSPNAVLSLSFAFIPTIYRPIEFNPSSYSKNNIHLWATFSPPLNNFETPVDIELLQAFSIEDEQSDIKYGLYYNLNKETPFECIGKSSSPHNFLGPTGLTQIHSFAISRMNGKCTFFILNVANYTGTVTLHFILDPKGKFDHFDDKNYMQPKNSQEIGTIRTIDVKVEPNKKFCVPYFLYFETHEFKKNTFEFFECETIANFDKTKIQNENGQREYSDRVRSEIEFHSEIMKNVRLIPENENVNFLRTNVLPFSEKVSLVKTIEDFHLQPECDLRIYVGGSRTFSIGNDAYTDFWNQGFIVYDKNSGQRCPELSQTLTSKPINQYTATFSKSFLPLKLKWNSILTLNLNQIGSDKILVYFVSASSSRLQEALPSGFFMISHLCNEYETLLFRNLIYADLRESHFAVCFRFEFCENEWKILPMRRYFNDKNEMDFVIDSMHANNWILPEILTNKRVEVRSNKFDDDDFLIADDKFNEI